MTPRVAPRRVEGSSSILNCWNGSGRSNEPWLPTRPPVAASGPAFVAVMVKVTFVPTGGVAALTVLVTRTSVSGTSTCAEAVLSTGVGSTVLAVAVAVFVTGLRVSIVAVTVSSRVSPLGIEGPPRAGGRHTAGWWSLPGGCHLGLGPGGAAPGDHVRFQPGGL